MALRDWLSPWTAVRDLRSENAHLRSLANTDPLTGVLNRRGLAARLDRVDGPWTGLFVDLDDFGRVNRRLGYTMGDAVLRAVVVRLDHALGTGVALGRVGGDEFLAVLPGAPLSVAAQLAEHAREAVRAVDLPGIGVMTCSVGLGRFDGRPDSLERALGQLEGALSDSKRAGKNRVAVVT